MYTVIENLGSDLVDRDLKPIERLHDVPGPAKVFFETRAEVPVLSKSVHRGWRHGVDGVRADQLLNIEHIAVFRILGSGACPKQSLRLGALRAQRLPARPGEKPFIALIGELGVGNRHFAMSACEGETLRIVGSLAQPCPEELVNGCVDATDKETTLFRRRSCEKVAPAGQFEGDGSLPITCLA